MINCPVHFFVLLMVVLTSLISSSGSASSPRNTSGCGLVDEEYKYFATLEGVEETLPEGSVINTTFRTFNIFTITITSTSYLAGGNQLASTPEAFIEPIFDPEEESSNITVNGARSSTGFQLLRFRLITDLTAYLRTATSSIVEFSYKLDCEDASSRHGTMLLDIVDVNNIAPEFHFSNMIDQTATPKYFIDWRQYEDDPDNFDYSLAAVGKVATIVDGDYLPENGRVSVAECTFQDGGEFECSRLVEFDLREEAHGDGDSVSGAEAEAAAYKTGSEYVIEFELVPDFADFLAEHYANESSLAIILTVTDEVHFISKEIVFEFVGRASNPGGDEIGGGEWQERQEEGWSLRVALGIAGGGTLIVLLVAALAYAVRRVILQKRNIDRLTEADILEFREGSNSSTRVSSMTSKSSCSRRDSILANAPVFARPYNNAYEIPRENLKIDETTVLGRGNFCIVMKGYVTTGAAALGAGRIPAAVKKVKENAGVYFRSLLTELKIMSFIGRHPNIVSLLGACARNLDKGELLVAVELCTNGNFRNYLKDRRAFYEDLLIEGKLVVRRNSMQSIQSGTTIRSTSFQTMTTLDLVRWSFQIANGMEFIASKNVIHGDLAARNILLDDNRVAKIADFGLSVRLVDISLSPVNYKTKSQCPLPWKYMAPESLRDLQFSLKTDVWTFGVLLWEIFTLGQKPFASHAWNEEFIEMLEDGMRLEKPKYTPAEIQELMADCWHLNPEKRPPFTEIKRRISAVLQAHADYTELCEEYQYLGTNLFPVPRLTVPGADSYGYGSTRSRRLNLNPYSYGIIRRASANERERHRERKTPSLVERPFNDADLY